MIHLDIIKYILNPLLNWDDCILINQVTSHRVSRVTHNKKKHYSKIEILASTSYLFDYEVLMTFDNNDLYMIRIWKDGSKYWYKDGKLHRTERDENGLTLPAIIWSDGDEFKAWYNNGEQHRTDQDLTLGYVLPAKMFGNEKRWYKQGHMHRTDIDEDGLMLPAISVNEIQVWFIEGKQQPKPRLSLFQRFKRFLRLR